MKRDINISVAEIENDPDKCYIFFIPSDMPEQELDWWFNKFPEQWSEEMDSQLLIAPASLETEYEIIESSTNKIKELLEEIENNE